MLLSLFCSMLGAASATDAAAVGPYFAVSTAGNLVSTRSGDIVQHPPLSI